MLTCFWDSFLFIYSNAIGGSSNAADDRAVQLALDGLQNAAKLANILSKPRPVLPVSNDNQSYECFV